MRLDHTGDIRQQNPDLQDYIWQNTPDPANPGTYLTEHHLGMKQALGLSYIYKLKGWLNIRQGIDYQKRGSIVIVTTRNGCVGMTTPPI